MRHADKSFLKDVKRGGFAFETRMRASYMFTLFIPESTRRLRRLTS
jgi:hypothetical protein